MASQPVRVGVLGGSGLYKMDGITDVREVTVNTPFGPPSDNYLIGKLGDTEVVFLPRHGRGHKYLPTEVNYRANIFGFKVLGVQWLIAVSAVGSLREEIDKGHVILVDQFIDKTRHRKDTFFGEGIVAHVPFSEPTCGVLRNMLEECGREVGATVHKTGTYVNMEGPAFSTFAESNLHRQWGGHVIGMTVAAEAKLAREAEISYAVLAMATDYDCWKEDEEAVTVEAVIATLHANVKVAQQMVKACIPKIVGYKGPHPQEHAMENAIMTSQECIPPARARALAPLIEKYREIPPGGPTNTHVLTSLAIFAGLAVVASKVLPKVLNSL